MKLSLVVLGLGLLVSTTAGVAAAQHPGDHVMPRGWKDDPVGYMKGMFDRGATNETVRQAQQALHDLGYYDGPIDGVMGPAERSAVWKFQQEHGIRVSGSLDPATVSALGLSDGGGYASPASSGPTNFGRR
jgi:peptidoglycan hydrolase-like protein with peptidoglycan-binding domain